MAELSARDRDLVVQNLQASSRWLALLSGRLADGGEHEAAGLTEAARRDLVAVCRRLRGDRPEPGGYNFADLYGESASSPPDDLVKAITETEAESEIAITQADDDADDDDPEELPLSNHPAKPLAAAGQPQCG